MPSHLQLILRRALVLAAAPLLLAGSARAGAFSTPFSFPCADDFLDAILGDPSAFAGLGDPQLCTKLCKGAAKDCKAWAKTTLKCESKLFVGAAAYQYADCKATSSGELLAECKANVKEGRDLAKLNVKSHLAEFLGDCEDWGADCAAECVAP